MSIAGRVTFPIPEARIREYCQEEVYEGYDNCHSVDNVITDNDIDATWRLNSYMHSQTSEASKILQRSSEIERLLSRIPDRELALIPEPEWQDLKKDIRPLLHALMCIPNVKLAKTMKILHLKRPRLFPILDNFVTQLLTKTNPKERSSDEQVGLGLRALGTARSDLIANMKSLEAIQGRLSDLPIPLAMVRIYDIVCWTYWKWDLPENNPRGEIDVTKWIKDATAFTGYRKHTKKITPRTLLRNIQKNDK